MPAGKAAGRLLVRDLSATAAVFGEPVRKAWMTERSKLWLSRFGRLGICAVALTWLGFDTDWGRLRQVLAEADWRLAMVGILSFGPAPVLIAFRQKLLLSVQDIHLSNWQMIKITFGCNFIIQALPLGTGGGDTAKAFYIGRDTPHKHEAVTAILFDRLIGVLGLLLLSGVILIFNWGNPAFAVWGRPIALSIGLLGAALCVGFSERIRRLVRFEQLLDVLPFSSHFKRIDRAVLMYRRFPGRVAACFVLTFVLQMISILAIYLTGWALGLVGEHPLAAVPIYLAYIPICFLTGALPIGVMEVTFVELLAGAAKLGASEAAISLSFMARIMQLIWALPGAMYVLRGRRQLGVQRADASRDTSPAECGGERVL